MQYQIKYKFSDTQKPQRDFINDLKSDYYLLSGGFRSGKTYGLVKKCVKISAIDNICIQGFVNPSYKMFNRDVLPMFRMQLRQDNIPYEYKKTDQILILPWHKKEACIQFASADNPDSLRGPTWGSCFINEPGIMNEDAFDIAISRVSDINAKIRQTNCAGTPEGFNYLYKKFVEEPLKNSRVSFQHTEDNPFLPVDYVDKLLSAYDSLMAKQYVHGEFVNINQLPVYYNFGRLQNTKPDILLDPLLSLILTMDFNINPMCLGITQVLKDILYTIDEIEMMGSNTEVALDEFISRYPPDKIVNGIKVYGDASGWSGTTKGFESDYDVIKRKLKIYKNFQLMIPRGSANPAVRDRINTVNGLFKNAKGEIKWFFSSIKCPKSIRDWEQVSYKEGTTQIDQSNSGLTHFSSGYGYFAEREYGVLKRRYTYTSF